MNPAECRDCGYKFEPNSRGCPQCALNLAAEAMVDRLVLRVLPVSLVSILVVAVLIVLYLR